MSVRYFAVLDESDRNVARNLFVVDDDTDPVALVVFDHSTGTWVQMSSLITFITGERSDECAEISEADAAALARAWKTGLPAPAERLRLARQG